MTSQRLVEDFAAWLWERDTSAAERDYQRDKRVPDNYLNEAAVFLAGELGQRLQQGEAERLRIVIEELVAASRATLRGWAEERGETYDGDGVLRGQQVLDALDGAS